MLEASEEELAEANMTAVMEEINLELIAQGYKPIHRPLVLIACLLGIGANLLNIAVLTRPRMRGSPTNFLLLGLSGAQLVLLLNFLCYSVYSSFLDVGNCALEFKSYAWLLFLAINVNLNVVSHSSALILTLILALLRFLVVHFPARGLVTLRRAKLAVMWTYIVVPVLFFPFYLNTQINLLPRRDVNKCAAYPEAYPAYYLSFHWPALTKVNFLSIAFLGKIAPCLVLATLSGLLLRDMRRAAKRRAAMLGRVDQNSEHHRVQTTVMLLIIVALVIAVELPQGILNALSAFLGKEFTSDIYQPLGDFFEMLTILYSSLNFVLYCVMSSQFRAAFRATFFGHVEINFRKPSEVTELNGNTLLSGPEGPDTGTSECIGLLSSGHLKPSREKIHFQLPSTDL